MNITDAMTVVRIVMAVGLTVTARAAAESPQATH
jgi:hypothetical protein